MLEVKQMLQESVGVEVPMIRLIFSGRQMNDEQKIKDYNVDAGSVIHMVLQLRGWSSIYKTQFNQIIQNCSLEKLYVSKAIDWHTF